MAENNEIENIRRAARDPKFERDVWTGMFERRKHELIAGGMSAEEADEQASREIRHEIRG